MWLIKWVEPIPLYCNMKPTPMADIKRACGGRLPFPTKLCLLYLFCVRSTPLYYAISNPLISLTHLHTQSTPGGNVHWYSPPHVGWVWSCWQIDSCWMSVDASHYTPYKKWHGDIEMQRRCVCMQPSQLQRKPRRTRTRMNGTIQFDSVFTDRAFGDALVLPFTWWLIQFCG